MNKEYYIFVCDVNSNSKSDIYSSMLNYNAQSDFDIQRTVHRDVFL